MAKTAPSRSRLGKRLILLSRARQQGVFFDFRHRLLSCRLNVFARRSVGRQKESAREVKGEDPGEITAKGGEPQERSQAAQYCENQEVMDDHCLGDELTEMRHDPGNEVR